MAGGIGLCLSVNGQHGSTTRVSHSDLSMVEDIDDWKEQWGDYMDYHMTALGK